MQRFNQKLLDESMQPWRRQADVRGQKLGSGEK